MATQRGRFWLGLGGVYLTVLSLFLLYGGLTHLGGAYTIMSRMGETDFALLFPYEASYQAAIFHLLEGIMGLTAGGVGIACIVKTPSVRRIETLAIALGLLQVLVIIDGVVRRQFPPFLNLDRAIIVFVFAKYWQCCLTDMESRQISPKDMFFPFFRGTLAK